MSSYIVIACDTPLPDGGDQTRPCPQVWYARRRVISLSLALQESAELGWTHDSVGDFSHCPVHSR